MTHDQFEVLAHLLRAREPAKTAARLVLVDGLPGAAAARQAGVTPQSVSNSLARYRAAEAAICAAWPIQRTTGQH